MLRSSRLPQGPGEPDRTGAQANHNTLSLPRDLSLDRAGQMRQRFVPELAMLRGSRTSLARRAVPAGGLTEAERLPGAAGLQLEILATFSVTAAAAAKPGRFGLLVLAAANLSEFTVVGFDPSREHFVLDRSRSGQACDEDVRAGPWPEPASGRVTLHAFVDHAVVEMIANATAAGGGSEGSTPIAAWVAPTSAASDGVALFSEVDGVTLEQLDVWQLASPQHAA